MANTYLWLKIIHIVSSTLLFGTGLGSAFYMYRAYLTKNIFVIYHTNKAVVFADWVFTTPTVFIQPISGFWMVYLLGYSFTSLWIYLSIGLYILAGACWLPVVWLQIRMTALSKQALETNQPLPAQYHRYMQWWFCLGWPAFIAIVVIFVLMVLKP
jgi:uncharacterized membrane protein